MLCADEAVREAISTVFRRFDELGSGSAGADPVARGRCAATAPPQRPADHLGPSHLPAVHDLLTNPAYAGAFVFGRTRAEKRSIPRAEPCILGIGWCRVSSGRS